MMRSTARFFFQASMVAAACSVALLSTGCLCLSIGGGSTCHFESGDHGTFVQSGSVMVQKGQEIDVYYPVPFAAPPNLQIDDAWNTHLVLEQTATHFRIRNESPIRQLLGGSNVDWTARGIQVTATPTAPPVPALAPAAAAMPGVR